MGPFARTDVTAVVRHHLRRQEMSTPIRRPHR